MAQTMPNSHERELLIQLMILRNAMKRNVEGSKQRLQSLPYGYRDAQLVLKLVDKLQQGLLNTVPDKVFYQYLELARKGRLRVELPGPLRAKTYSIVSNDDLAVLSEYALRNECGMCIKGGKEAERCQLRQALLTAAPPEEYKKDFACGCEYINYATDLINGEEVII